MSKRRFSDFEIFFTAVLGMAAVLVGRRLLGWITADVGIYAFAPSLAARFGASTTIANFSTFFVLLPMALAFIAIGIPFALRCLAALVRRTIVRRESYGLLALLACVVAMVCEAKLGSTGLASMTAIAFVSLWQAWGALAVRGERLGYWCLAAGGACLLGLAYYQSQYLAGATPSRFIAPTLLVVAFYLSAAGLILTVPAALTERRSRVAATAAWLGVLAWTAAPRLRVQALQASAADMLELITTSAGAAMLLVAALLRQLRG